MKYFIFIFILLLALTSTANAVSRLAISGLNMTATVHARIRLEGIFTGADLSGLVPYSGATGNVNIGAYNIYAATFGASGDASLTALFG